VCEEGREASLDYEVPPDNVVLKNNKNVGTFFVIVTAVLRGR